MKNDRTEHACWQGQAKRIVLVQLMHVWSLPVFRGFTAVYQFSVLVTALEGSVCCDQIWALMSVVDFILDFAT